jgi:hypothetical protein
VTVTALPRKLWRAARDPARTREQIDIARDCARFERRYGEMLRSIPTPADGPRALFVSLADWPYQVKIEGLLGKGLALGGYTPVMLTLPNARWAQRYFNTFGIDRFVYLEEFERTPTADVVEEALQHALSGEVTFEGVKALTFRGARVGVHTLSSLSRTFRQGRVSLTDPEIRATLERQLRDSMLATFQAERVLDAVQPDLVLFIEKGYHAFGSIYDIAVDRGLNVIQFVHAGIHAKDALVLKRFTPETQKFHPTSLSADTWRLVREMPWTAERERELQDEFRVRYDDSEKHPDAGIQAGKRMKSADEIREELGLRPDRKVAALFSHILWDANMFFGEDLFEDQETWLVETVRAACENDQVDWIVKPHPANVHKGVAGLELNDKAAIESRIGSLPPHIRLLEAETDINTYSLFAVADYGITIRGTIGLELPCFGIPVLTAGTGRYSGLGFTIDSENAEQYLERLRHIHEIPPLDRETIEAAKRHAWALFRLRPFRLTSAESHYAEPDKLMHPLGYNLDLTLRSAEQVRHASDLRRFAEWAADRSQLDYLSGLPD